MAASTTRSSSPTPTPPVPGRASNATGVRASNGSRVRTTRVLIADNTTTGMDAQTSGQIVPFVENQVAANPPGTATCDLPTGSVACPAACPDVTVPQPVCEGAVMA